MVPSHLVELLHFWRINISWPISTKQSQLLGIEQYICQEIIWFMQERVTLKNSTQCKFSSAVKVQPSLSTFQKNYNYQNENKKTNCCYSYADQISIGDEVLVVGSEELTLVKVVKVSTLSMQVNHYCGIFLTRLFHSLNVYFLIND